MLKKYNVNLDYFITDGLDHLEGADILPVARTLHNMVITSISLALLEVRLTA